MKEIIFYKAESGKSPVEDFLDTLDDKQSKKVAWVLKAVREIDPIPVQYFKKLVNTQDIWEVMVTMGKNIFRLLGFIDGQDIIVLTNGFQKKTKKTPRSEKKIAEERKNEYLKRRNK